MQRKAVHDGTHDEFTHTVGQVVAVPVVAADAGSLFVPRAHGTGQVGGTAEQFRQMRSDGVQDVAVGDTGGDLRLVRVKTGDGGGGNAFPVGRQCAAHPALEFGSEIGDRLSHRRQTELSTRLQALRRARGRPTHPDVLRHDERFVLPAERGTHGGVFIRPIGEPWLDAVPPFLGNRNRWSSCSKSGSDARFPLRARTSAASSMAAS